MKIKRSHVIVAALMLLVGIGCVRGFWLTEVFHTHKSNESNRTALLQVRGAVGVGDSPGDVLAAYWQHRTDDLRLFADSPTEWTIKMPLEFGASDWTLLIEFQDGRVSAVRVRTSDGPPPNNGPKDQQKGKG